MFVAYFCSSTSGWKEKLAEFTFKYRPGRKEDLSQAKLWRDVWYRTVSGVGAKVRSAWVFIFSMVYLGGVLSSLQAVPELAYNL